MSDISPALHAEVVLRAGNRCEYCQLSQLGQEAAFHIDHVVPRAAGGPNTADNLALACVSCSLRKWAHQTAPDPDSGEEVSLFNPRTQAWVEHFRWEARKGSTADPDRSGNGGCSGDEPAADRRYPPGGSNPGAPPTHMIPLPTRTLGTRPDFQGRDDTRCVKDSLISHNRRAASSSCDASDDSTTFSL